MNVDNGGLKLLLLLSAALFMTLALNKIRGEAVLELNNTKDKPTQRVLNRMQRDPSFDLELDPQKKVVLLLTAFRSGSTFLGQLFNNNPGVQYIFEPFHEGTMRTMQERGQILGAREDHTEADMRMLYFQQIIHNCSVWKTPFTGRYSALCCMGVCTWMFDTCQQACYLIDRVSLFLLAENTHVLKETSTNSALS